MFQVFGVTELARWWSLVRYRFREWLYITYERTGLFLGSCRTIPVFGLFSFSAAFFTDGEPTDVYGFHSL